MERSMVSKIDVRRQHARYDKASDQVKAALDRAFTCVVDNFRSSELPAATGDAAEELVAANYLLLRPITSTGVLSNAGIDRTLIVP
jgi:hypothetical protein